MSVGHSPQGLISVSVGGSGGCTWAVSTDEDWLETLESTVSEGGTVSVSVSDNRSVARSGTVSIGNESVIIEQADGCVAGWSTGPLGFYAGGSQNARASGSSACTFGVSDDRDWIKVGASSVAGSGSVSVSVDPNNGLERTGTVTFSHANGDATVTITQRNGCMPAGGTTSLTFGKAGGSQNAGPGGSSACTFGVSADQDWIEVGASSVAGSRSVSVSVGPNNGLERTGTVTFSHANGDATVTITQRNGCMPAGGRTSLTFGKAGGSQDATAGGSSACTFGVSDDRDWIEVGASSVAGSGSVSVSVDPNNGLERTGTVTFSHANGDASVAITQRNGCMPAGGTTSLTFGKTAGAQDATAGGSAACTFAVSDDQDWIEVGAASVAGGGTVAVTVEANSGPARTGTVTVGDASVAVTQADGCTAAGSTAALTFGSGTGAQDATAGGSAACTFAVSDDQDWILVSASSVAGGGTVTVTVPEHTGTVARTGTVTIGIASVQITQAGGCLAAPGVTVPLVSFGNGGGALAVGVGESSVCEYAVTADPAWVTVQPVRVTGGGTVTVTVPEDLSGGGPRRGMVTIGAAGVRVAQGNTPPVAAADAVTTWRETATPVAVLANDTDADDDPLAVAAVVVTAPAQGTAAVSADGQTVTYTSAAGWAGDETFTYQVTDDVGGTAEATVTVTVRAAAPFTDPVLTVGVTPIKAVHMTELRTRADAVRVGCGLTAATWTDPVLTAKVTPIKAVHMLELREAVIALE